MPTTLHLLASDGTVYCKGLQLIKLGRPLNADPLKITVHSEEATCEVCLTAWVRARALAG